jgi:predicted transcriptional regulator
MASLSCEKNIPMVEPTKLLCGKGKRRPKWWFFVVIEYRNRENWKVTEEQSFGKDTGDTPYFETQA